MSYFVFNAVSLASQTSFIISFLSFTLFHHSKSLAVFKCTRTTRTTKPLHLMLYHPQIFPHFFQILVQFHFLVEIFPEDAVQNCNSPLLALLFPFACFILLHSNYNQLTKYMQYFFTFYTFHFDISSVKKGLFVTIFFTVAYWDLKLCLEKKRHSNYFDIYPPYIFSLVHKN